jgi:hypothetical protein
MIDFEIVRKSRYNAVKEASLQAGNILRLPPGPAQAARDAALKGDGLSATGINQNERLYSEGTSYSIADRKLETGAMHTML